MDNIRIVDEILAQLTPRGFRNWTCLQVTALLIKRTPETPLHNKPVMLIILSKLGNVAFGRQNCVFCFLDDLFWIHGVCSLPAVPRLVLPGPCLYLVRRIPSGEPPFIL